MGHLPTGSQGLQCFHSDLNLATEPLTLEALGFLLPGYFPPPPPFCKITSIHPRDLKLSGLIAYIVFYKICKFESTTIANDVIMTSIPKQWQNSDLHKTKQIINHLKGIDKSYPQICFLLNLSHCVKNCRHFCQN